MNLVRSVRSKLPKIHFKVDPNSTHGEFLNSALTFLASKKSEAETLVLFEIGTGGTSSFIMRAFLNDSPKTYLYSFENSDEWHSKYLNDYPSHERHEIVLVENDEWEKTLKEILSRIPNNSLKLAFIDSSPWESRVASLKVLANCCDVIVIHDVDYFPHHRIFGEEIEPIKYAPSNPFFYGKLKARNLGMRRYDDVAISWIEVFPETPGYFTGPPTLIASNTIDISKIELPRNSILQARSE